MQQSAVDNQISIKPMTKEKLVAEGKAKQVEQPCATY